VRGCDLFFLTTGGDARHPRSGPHARAMREVHRRLGLLACWTNCHAAIKPSRFQGFVGIDPVDKT
jgi:hypothetical protein